jgi:hypothetical protein
MKVAASTVSPLPSVVTMMEDRKRHGDDIAPLAKRQAVNGGSKAATDADMPWKDDLEVCLSATPFTIRAVLHYSPGSCAKRYSPR